MHLSTHTWMRAEPFEVTLARAARLGYASVEISADILERRGVEACAAALRAHGLRCWGGLPVMIGERNLAAADTGARARTVAYTCEVARGVAALGGRMITVVPATVGKLVPDATPEAEWDWLVAALREIQAVCAPLGVRLGIEPLNRFETYLINRVDQALALAEAVGPACGVCIDTFHMAIEERDMLAAIRRAGPRLVDFHVADNNRMAPGQGALDWPRIIGVLGDTGYDGALAAEFVAPIDRTPANPWPGQVETEPSEATAEQLRFLRDHGSNLLSEAFYTSLAEVTARTLLPLL